jgi:hypothetical protein
MKIAELTLLGNICRGGVYRLSHRVRMPSIRRWKLASSPTYLSSHRFRRCLRAATEQPLWVAGLCHIRNAGEARHAGRRGRAPARHIMVGSTRARAASIRQRTARLASQFSSGHTFRQFFLPQFNPRASRPVQKSLEVETCETIVRPHPDMCRVSSDRSFVINLHQLYRFQIAGGYSTVVLLDPERFERAANLGPAFQHKVPDQPPAEPRRTSIRDHIPINHGWEGQHGLRHRARREFLSHRGSLEMAVRPDGANHQWRKIPPGELSIDPVADERLSRATGRAGAS